MSLKSTPSIVDVRTQEEYLEGHIGGAVNIPLDQIQDRLQEFREMSTPIIMYCRSGNRSGIAVNILKQKGIADAMNGGGINDMKGGLIQ